VATASDDDGPCGRPPGPVLLAADRFHPDGRGYAGISAVFEEAIDR
jgi:hypothetical protein